MTTCPSTKTSRTTFNVVLAFAIIGFLVALIALCEPPKDRKDFSLEITKVVEQAKNSKYDLHTSVDQRITFYKKRNAELDTNRLVVAVLCGLGLVIILTEVQSVELPFAKIKLTRKLACCLLPLVLLYSWFEFGYLLNVILDSRLVAMKLIDAAHDASNPSDNPSISDLNDDDYLKIHNTLTRASELEDAGLVDAWFWNFYSDRTQFPVPRKGPVYSLVPAIAILWYAAIYGLLHSLIYLLPISALDKKNRSFLWIFMGIASLAIAASHWSFYYAGRHQNWFQAAISGFFILFLLLLRGKTTALKNKSDI